jgi:hypothetical protein
MLNKILQWIAVNGLSILGIVQVAIKFVKEVLTLVVNLLFPIIPDGKFEDIILKVRAIVEKADSFVEKIKGWLLKVK